MKSSQQTRVSGFRGWAHVADAIAARPIVLAVLTLGAIALSACVRPATPAPLAVNQPSDVGTQAPALETPTEFPVAPASPYATDTAAPPAPEAVATANAEASLTVIPVPTEIPGLEATLVARATASPYATAEPARIQMGAPSYASVRRGDLLLEARLAKDDYLAGESGRAEITLRNDGKQPLFVAGPNVVLTDEQGKPAPPSYFQYPPGYSGAGWGGRPLQPGRSVTSTITFGLPPAEQAAGHAYSLSLAAHFSRAALKKDRPDNVYMDLKAGPLPLKVSTPGPGQYLKASLQADAGGYTLTLTNDNGWRVRGPAWGASQTDSPNGYSVGPMPDSPDGTWSARWVPYLLESGRPLHFQAWVAAPGYVGTSISKTVTISEGVEDLGWVEHHVVGEQIQTFHSIEDAWPALGALALYKPGRLPPGARLQRIEVGTPRGFRISETDVRQYYRLQAGGWLLLSQMNVTPPAEPPTWAPWRTNPETRAAQVGQDQGYMLEGGGWRALAWKAGSTGFELAAGVSAMTTDELSSIAASLEPAGK